MDELIPARPLITLVKVLPVFEAIHMEVESEIEYKHLKASSSEDEAKVEEVPIEKALRLSSSESSDNQVESRTGSKQK